MNSILHTDMAKMNDLRAELAKHLETHSIRDGYNVENFIDRSSEKAEEESKQLIMSSVLHAADISTSLRDFDVSQVWAECLFEEFFN